MRKMMAMASKMRKCALCDNEVRKFPLCQSCLYDTGKDYTAANFDLKGLSLIERQLVFLWACGQDISQYFDNFSVPAQTDDSDIFEPISKKMAGFMTMQTYGKGTRNV
jgi:hypothetical protein